MIRAVERTLDYPYKIWGFGEGPALLAVLRAARAHGRPDWVDAVAELVAPSLTAAPDEEVDHLVPVEVLLELRPRLDVSAALDRFVAAVAGAARPEPGQPRVHRPHHPVLGRMVWVDCLHTDGPGLAALDRLDDAVDVTAESVQALQDATGLFSHGYRVDIGEASGVHWARGQGWALYGLVGLLERVPDATLSAALDRLLRALAAHAIDGRWRTIVDDPNSPEEASLSPMVAATVRRGIAAGVVDPEWQALADRALAATLDAVRSDGTLLVSEATPVGPPATYYERGEGVFPWGQGPLLDALEVAA